MRFHLEISIQQVHFEPFEFQKTNIRFCLLRKEKRNQKTRGVLDLRLLSQLKKMYRKIGNLSKLVYSVFLMIWFDQAKSQR